MLLPIAATCQTEKKNDKEFEIVVVGFYNLENLFDTIVDRDTNKILQDDFTPHGEHRWTSRLYWEKLERMSKVLAELGTELTPDGAAIIGLAELENKAVVEDLINQPALKDRNYEIVHYESPDARGIDVALIYQPKYFKLTSSKYIPTTSPERPDWRTRNQMLVSGKLKGEDFHFMVAHWPSRRGGEKRSRPGRVRAAEIGKAVIDSILAADRTDKVIYMGDLNDDPNNKSLKRGMMAVADPKELNDGEMFNAMEKFYNQGIGTLAWRDSWNLFDQILLTPTAVANSKEDYKTLKYYASKIHNKEYLKNPSGSFKGYPFRTYVGATYQGGYSDHFPVYVYLVKEKK